MEYRDIPIDQIDRDPAQARTSFPPESLAELAESIKAHGVIQPVEVEALPDGRYRLHHGERRWRASKLAGRETIPAIVAPPRAEDEAVVRGLLENLHREDLNPIDEARVYKRLIDMGWRVMRIARETGRAQATISGRLAWLEMEPEIQKLVAAGHLPRSETLATALRKLTPEVRVPLAEKMAAKALSLKGCVAAVERAAEKLAAPPPKRNYYREPSHPVPMVRHGAPGIPVHANGSAPAIGRNVHDAADAMCRACHWRPKVDYVPSWEIIEAEAAAVCAECQKRDGPALPDICRNCPGVKMLRALTAREQEKG